MANRTMFGEAKHTYLSKIISLRTPAEARASAHKLRDEFFTAFFNTKRLRVARATQLAANRARAASRIGRLSGKERAEFREIAKIYDTAADGMFRAYKKTKGGKGQ